MRYRKRQEMAVGEWDNITERCPKMRMRFAPWAIEEMCAWLHLHAHRYAEQYDGLKRAMESGADVQGSMEYASAACRTVLDLIARLRDRWSVAQYHDACGMAAESLGTLFTELPPLRDDVITHIMLQGEDNAPPVSDN